MPAAAKSTKKTQVEQDAEKTAEILQGAVVDPEVKAKGEYVSLNKDGELIATIEDTEFKLAESIAPMAIMEWAASSDEELDTPQGIASIFLMLQAIIHEDYWYAFRKTTRRAHTEAIDLVELVNEAVEKISARPTEQPETS